MEEKTGKSERQKMAHEKMLLSILEAEFRHMSLLKNEKRRRKNFFGSICDRKKKWILERKKFCSGKKKGC